MRWRRRATEKDRRKRGGCFCVLRGFNSLLFLLCSVLAFPRCLRASSASGGSSFIEEGKDGLVEFDGDGAQRADGLLDLDRHDLRAAQGDHLAEIAFVDALRRADAQACAENPVEHRGRAATLDMAEGGGARLEAGAPLDLFGDVLADVALAQNGMPERIQLRLRLVQVRQFYAFGGDDDAVVLAAR